MADVDLSFDDQFEDHKHDAKDHEDKHEHAESPTGHHDHSHDHSHDDGHHGLHLRPRRLSEVLKDTHDKHATYVSEHSVVVSPVDEAKIPMLVDLLGVGTKGQAMKDKPKHALVQFVDDESMERGLDKLTDMEFEGFKLTVERAEAHVPGIYAPNTTLVIKNLPFSMKHEKMTEMLQKLEIKPQSLNFHYDDKGTFRGMAFAKFRAMEDAVHAYDQLSGMDVSGRKLKIEYKKKGSGNGAPGTSVDRGSNLGTSLGTSLDHHSYLSTSPHHHGHLTPSGKPPLPPGHHRDGHSGSHRESHGFHTLAERELDLGNPEVKNVYDQLMRFKESSTLREIAFPSTMIGESKHLYELVASKLGLSHTEQVHGELKVICITKALSRLEEEAPSPTQERRGSDARGSKAIPIKSSRGSGGSPAQSGGRGNSVGNGGHWDQRATSPSHGGEGAGQRGAYGRSVPAYGSSPMAHASHLSTSPNSKLGSSLSTSPGIHRSPLLLARAHGEGAVRLPKGPDGSKGFPAGRGRAQPTAPSPAATAAV
eukprot:tig00000383_g24640.t1